MVVVVWMHLIDLKWLLLLLVGILFVARHKGLLLLNHHIGIIHLISIDVSLLIQIVAIVVLIALHHFLLHHLVFILLLLVVVLLIIILSMMIFKSHHFICTLSYLCLFAFILIILLIININIIIVIILIVLPSLNTSSCFLIKQFYERVIRHIVSCLNKLFSLNFQIVLVLLEIFV